MLGLFIALGVGSAVSSIIGAGVREQQRKAEYDSQLSDLNRQKDQLSEANSQWQANYGLSVSHANAKTQEANTELDLLAGQTKQNRDNQLGVSATYQEGMQALKQAQLATLMVDAAKAEGAAIHQAATSGFRNEGTALSTVEQTRRESADVLSNAKAQLSLSRYANFQNAKQTYVSATQQADAYQRQIEANNNDLHRQLEQWELQKQQYDETYKRQSSYIDSDINYMNTTGKKLMTAANHADYFASTTSGLNSIFNSYTNGASQGFGWGFK